MIHHIANVHQSEYGHDPARIDPVDLPFADERAGRWDFRAAGRVRRRRSRTSPIRTSRTDLFRRNAGDMPLGTHFSRFMCPIVRLRLLVMILNTTA